MILPLTADERPILDEVGRLDLGGKTYWNIVQAVADRLKIADMEVKRRDNPSVGSATAAYIR